MISGKLLFNSDFLLFQTDSQAGMLLCFLSPICNFEALTQKTGRNGIARVREDALATSSDMTFGSRASWSRIGSPPDKSIRQELDLTPTTSSKRIRNTTKRSPPPVVPVLPNDLCHWVLQSQCPRSLGKKAKRTWGWFTRSLKKVSIPTIVLWGTFESLHISLEEMANGFPTTWNFIPKLLPKKETMQGGTMWWNQATHLFQPTCLSR